MFHHPLALRCLHACFAVSLLAAGATAADKADPNGKWKWTYNAPDGQNLEFWAVLKLEEGKLTGKVEYAADSTEISDGEFADNAVKFNVVREQDGNKFKAVFNGKVDEDLITGKIEVTFNDQMLSFDWNASREKP